MVLPEPYFAVVQAGYPMDECGAKRISGNRGDRVGILRNSVLLSYSQKQLQPV